MTKGTGALAAAILALATGAACTVQQSDSAPPLTGPSGFAQDMTVTATPDVITRDGFSQSAIVVRVFGPNGQPASAVPLRVDILDSSGTPVDFGSLSTKSIVTGTDGRASTVYTSPPPPPPTFGGFTTFATIRAVALGSDAQNSKAFTAEIRLVPPGVILPPAGTPTASFTTSPSSLLAGLPINFDASASQPGSGASAITSYTWSFGDGTSGSGRTTTKTYSSANTFSVTLTVTNDRGLSASSTQPLTVGNAALPGASFTFSPAAPGIGEAVFFNASASTAAPGRTIASYRWAFGDGGTATGVTASHSYSTAGTYTVTLTVTDDLGGSVTTTQSITPGSPPTPTARFTVSPTSPAAGQQALFSAATSSTAQGQTITDYFWNFGDNPSCPPVTGTVPSTCYQQTSSPTITHTFTTAGTFSVNLVVRDNAGRTSATSSSVSVSAVASSAPTPNFTFSPAQPGVGETVFFNASTSTASSGRTITAYAWTFGDGKTATGVTASNIYSTAGTYSVQLRVTDDAGQSTTSTAQNITVGSPPAPNAEFTSSPAAPVVGDNIVFDASGSSTAQGQTITNLAWNFGDTTPIISCPGNASCVGTRIISHAYTAAGTYTVNLVVTDSANRTDPVNHTVVVGTGNPEPLITASPNGGPNPITIAFNSSGSRLYSGATITTYAWDFGDAVSGALNTSSAANPSHLFVNEGTFVVRLTITDSQGRVGTITINVTIT